ncbi:unnamed protein product [Parascedosporium putredinis]|uniref:Cell division cycle protein 123 n=1 Tax=Parascedosporium putredinis TaxID=1442378 RepID=A0A9P1H9I2_9PEZI|nr:unnamed protein product [Parascedosporium putredinis]CAI8003087.1 unnamed protein product [Parascedosporium putredinis]
MPSIESLAQGASPPHNPTTREDAPSFPPVTREHILNCSYDKWFPKYKSSCIKSRIIPLPPDFVAYLREDGIILADDDDETPTMARNRTRMHEDDGSDDSDDDSPTPVPPNRRFPELHAKITETIQELGGSVVPKLNWSSPKDATWISPFNNLKCTTANDIYLLIKSSSFASHDLEHPFDGCAPASQPLPFTPVLVLRPHFPIQPSLEFRCFVKQRSLVGISQRDVNHFEFLGKLRPLITSRIQKFFSEKLQTSFPDPCFIFDVYIPEDAYATDDLGKVRLMDINPWAPRTDTLLFDWGELLDMRRRETTDEDDVDILEPEMRLIEKDDPAAFNFSSTQYSAHKLPKEVVDASMAGEGAWPNNSTDSTPLNRN